MNTDIAVINEQVKEESRFVNTLTEQMSKVIVGQTYMVERLLRRGPGGALTGNLRWSAAC